MVTWEEQVAQSRHLPSAVARPRVLVITSELPWPLNTGGHIRTFHLLRSLGERFDVRLVTVVEADEPSLLDLPGVSVRAAVVGQRRPWPEALRVAKAAISNEPYVMFRRHDRRELRRLVRDELSRETPAAIYLDHLDPFSFRDLFPDVPLIADMHNVYSRLTERVADEHRGLKGIYLRREARLLATMEQKVAGAADIVMTVSGEEQETFRELGSRDVRLVPNGVDCSAYQALPIGRQHETPTLLYLGAMSWQPNAKAAAFLAREVLPAVRSRIPNARLQLVGRNPGADVLALSELPGVEVAANVPDVGVYLEHASLLAVPLDSGGGTRLKILEAFAAGLPVVSTPIGCEGIDATNGRHLWIAPREAFADAICDALSNPEASRCLAENARQLALDCYDWPAIGRSACEAVLSAIGGAR